MVDIDFQHIVPRSGSKPEAFEALCCQLAPYSLPKDILVTRLYGAGGDGGIECFADLPDGRVGWQAKYVFDIKSLLAQATISLATAQKIHTTLSRYVVCFPFDLTGPTGRRGQSSQEKLDKWRTIQEKKAAAEGRSLEIEAWPASKLLELLLQHDSSGGIREYFFNQNILTKEWFSEHLKLVTTSSNPRYTPELNVNTNLWKWFAAFGRTAVWSDELINKLQTCRKVLKDLTYALGRSDSDPLSPAWPEDYLGDTQTLADDINGLLSKCTRLPTITDRETYKQYVSDLNGLLSRLISLESKLMADFDVKHGQGKADSPGFRQFMAEYQASFPTANLDTTRDVIDALRGLFDWLSSPACSLAYETVFVLSGVAGSGKTHGVCDAANRRFSEGLLTCVTFGHEFRGEPVPWTRLSEALGLPATLGMNALLDAMNAAGETSGSPLMLFIDAINETRPYQYWHDRLSAFSQSIQCRPYLRLCITCRTSYLAFCLPDGHSLTIVEHIGFSGIERYACQAFFQYFKLDPPIAPILQPELANPLYLRLVCETLRSRGLRRLPTGWHGIAPTIRAFLEEKERQFSTEYSTSPGSDIVGGCLTAISRVIAESGNAALALSKAQQIISAARPQASTIPVLDWLIRADLLMEDAPVNTDLLCNEGVVRPAFERLGDFLIAAEMLEKCKQGGIVASCQPGGMLHALLKDSSALSQNSGVLAAISILIPEQHDGMELPDFVDDISIHNELVRITVRSFPSRDQSSFSRASESLTSQALALQDFSYDAMDAILSISWQQSTIDAFWLDMLLKQKPLARRDAYWCAYLHDRFESNGIVRRLIDAAFELPLDRMEHEVAERWATVLLWFTAAADRRVKDMATRAVIAILVGKQDVLPRVLQRMIVCDDDEVRERALLTSYGALIILRDTVVIIRVTFLLQEAFRHEPEAFDNALIRDLIRCITELAQVLNILPNSCDPKLTMQPITSIWPLELPSEDQVVPWGELLHFTPNEMFSDFYKYSMYCLRHWEHAFPKEKMGKWIIQRIARDFGYKDSECDRYDSYMLRKYGGGRSKPTWAERIGKKYLWIGMYQLASRLYDHIERKQDSWEPKPLHSPLILLEERKLDPTLHPRVSVERQADAWWITASADLDSTGSLSDEGWVKSQENIPSLDNLLSIIEYDKQKLRLLVSYPSWGHRDEEAGLDALPYRHLQLNIESYLVQKRDFHIAYKCLHHRNFRGRWMPNGATWLYGFVGEYPWATPFNTESEEWNGRGGGDSKLPVVFQPSWNQIVAEWEYDASIPRYFHIFVPERTFFSPGDLWWDGKDGFCYINGRTIFRDPSVMELGPEALLADADDLLERLEKLGLRLIWTILGEKLILGGRLDNSSPRRTFSQVAYLEEDGSVQIGAPVFYDDYDQDRGPLQRNSRRSGRNGLSKRKKGPKTGSNRRRLRLRG
jgi:hypothetical protein